MSDKQRAIEALENDYINGKIGTREYIPRLQYLESMNECASIKQIHAMYQTFKVV